MEAQTQANDQWLRHVLEIHCDPGWGSQYWLEKERSLGFSLRDEIRTVGDLHRAGPMDADALSARPFEDFVPQRYHSEKERFIVAETGGSTGMPKTTAYSEDEFSAAFVVPFVRAAQRVKFPRGVNWLWIGPSGPHIIGKAARACAKTMNSPDPFSVDFDPRWAKKLPEGSLARQRYLAHIEEQALRILDTQHVGVLFSTPAVLTSIAEKIPDKTRKQMRGIHFGGMALEKELLEALHNLFPHAIFLSGYGNSLFGMCPELEHDSELRYYPFGKRMIPQVVSEENGEADALRNIVPYGERGRVVFHRLDETFLILNMFERDTAVRLSAPDVDGFWHDGLGDPQPLRTPAGNTVGDVGLY